MKKYIRVIFKNGEKYDISSDVIATNRTNYYAQVDGYEKDSSEWVKEFEYSLEESELLDWVKNNMNWSDLKDDAVRIRGESFNYEEEFSNSKIKVILKD